MALAKLTIRLNPADNIVVARADLLPGTELPDEGVTVKARIPVGHKIATRPVRDENRSIAMARSSASRAARSRPATMCTRITA